MSTAYLDLQQLPKNLKFTHGHIPNLRLAQNHAAVVISLETLRAPNNVHRKQLMKAYVTHLKNLPSGKNVVCLIAHQNGLKVNGASVQPHVDKTEQEKEKCIARKLVQTGKIFRYILI
jgi:Zn-dependent metalloprotease